MLLGVSLYLSVFVFSHFYYQERVQMVWAQTSLWRNVCFDSDKEDAILESVFYWLLREYKYLYLNQIVSSLMSGLSQYV